MNAFLDFLEKASAYLDKISKPMEKRMAHFICVTQIVVCLIAMAIAVVFFAYNFLRQTAFEVRGALIVFLLAVLLILGPYTYLLITRDLKQLRNQASGKKEDTAKKRKIEF